MRHRGEKGRSGERTSCPANAARTASEEVRETAEAMIGKGFVERRFPFHFLLYGPANKIGVNEEEKPVKKLLKTASGKVRKRFFQSSSIR